MKDFFINNHVSSRYKIPYIFKAVINIEKKSCLFEYDILRYVVAMAFRDSVYYQYTPVRYDSILHTNCQMVIDGCSVLHMVQGNLLERYHVATSRAHLLYKTIKRASYGWRTHSRVEVFQLFLSIYVFVHIR